MKRSNRWAGVYGNSDRVIYFWGYYANVAEVRAQICQEPVWRIFKIPKYAYHSRDGKLS